MGELEGGKFKGVAQVRLPNGRIRLPEIHWYEAHGIGKREFKLKVPFWISHEKERAGSFCRLPG